MNFYKREEAYEASLKYFKGDTLAADVWVNKYALKETKDGETVYYEKTPDDMHRRLASELYRIESKYQNPMSEDFIFDLIKNFEYIIPQGSPMAGIGNEKQVVSLSNCFVIGNDADSYGSIMQVDEEQIQLMKRRGGVGHDLSHIRPAGTPVKNSALTSTGLVPFMTRYSNSTNEVAQGGRRGALMLTVSVKHPDSEDFIDAKLEQGKVTGANISVKVTDEFMKATKNAGMFTQCFPIDSDDPVMCKQVDAQKLWKKIIHNAWKSAEPGVLFWDTVMRESVPDCYQDHGFTTVSTNPSLRWNTKILTKNGIINIKDAAENNNGKVIVKNILGEWKEGLCFKSGLNKQLYKITFTNSSYEVYCTPEHKWPLINTNGQIVNKHTGKVLKKETKNLSKLDKIYFPQFDNVLNVDNTLTQDEGFVIGWNLGDGWKSYHKSQKRNLYGFIFSKDDFNNKVHEKILNYINSVNNRDCNLRENKGIYEFTSSSKKIDDFFQNIGFENKSKGLPTKIWKSNDDFVKGVIDGLFSSDGCVDEKRRRILFTSAHEKLANDIHKLLSFYGIKSYLIKSEHVNPFDNTKKSLRYDIYINNKSIIKFNNRFKLSNIEKQSKIDNIIKSNNYGKFSKNSEIESNREYLTIKSVEISDIYEDVYDITVYDDTHTFQTEVGITGNCGEITLCSYDSCRLLAINLYSFVEKPFTKDAFFNWDKFKEYVIYAERMMDDIIDLEEEKIDMILKKIETDPENEATKRVERDVWNKIMEMTRKGRRTGLGVTAEGDMLAALGLRYGTPEATDFSIEVHKTLAINAYKSSAIMAKERGSFPVYDYNREKSNPFIQRLKDADPELDKMFKECGRRNIALLTIAPTGSVSILTQTTSGIEPAYLVSYKRRRKINPTDKSGRVDFIDAEGVKWEEYNVFHHKFETWLEINGYNVDQVKAMKDSELKEIIEKSPYYKATSNDVDWVEKVRMQGNIQKFVDHSISVTVNLPNSVTEEIVSKVYETGWESGCKGITVYRDGSRQGVIMSTEGTTQNVVIEQTENNAKPRQKRLECEVVRFTNNKEKWIGFLGLMTDDKGEKYPYELFTGLSDEFYVPQNVERGEIVKFKENGAKSRYDFVYKDKDGYNVTMEGLSRAFSREFWNYSKLVSALLRHRMHLPSVINVIDGLQLDGDKEAAFGTWKSGVKRIIKKYINSNVVGEHCPECGATEPDLVYENGCKTCKKCGWSKCE